MAARASVALREPPCSPSVTAVTAGVVSLSVFFDFRLIRCHADFMA
jgi:hypothetical protein